MRRNFRTYDLAVRFYHQTQTLKLPRHLKGQLNRASSSVALNLAEGAGRATRADQKRFFDMAFGSLRECQGVLDLSLTEDSPLLELVDSLAAHLYQLIRACK